MLRCWENAGLTPTCPGPPTQLQTQPRHPLADRGCRTHLLSKGRASSEGAKQGRKTQQRGGRSLMSRLQEL